MPQTNHNHAFLHACERGNLDGMTAALNAGADANVQDASGHGAWHHLARRPASPGTGKLSRSHEGIVRLLLRHGVVLDAPRRDGLTPLALAVAGGNERLTARLLTLGANPNNPGEDGMRLLAQAAERGHPDTVSALLTAGADVHAVDAIGWTALHHAAHSATVMSTSGTYGVAFCVINLLNAGARVDAPTVSEATGNPSETPLQLALRRNSPSVAERLLAAGALGRVGVRARHALLEQGVERKAWETLDQMAEHGLLDGLRPQVLVRLFAKVPPGSTTHRLLEGHALRAALGTPSEAMPRTVPRARL